MHIENPYLTYQPGVTVIICGYNSAKRLPETLAHVAQQIVPVDLDLDVIVMDNNSTDGMATVARKLWIESGKPFPLLVMDEPKPGKVHALKRALRQTMKQYFIICDDDNWMAPDFVAKAYESMEAMPQVALMGGQSQVASDGPIPDWFEGFGKFYAVGQQAEQSGDITDEIGFVWGACSVVRREAYDEIKRRGFVAQLLGRIGKRQTGGEDTELGFEFRLQGYRIYYNDELHFKHFMPAGRLQWANFDKMVRGFALAELRLIHYRRLNSGKYFTPENGPLWKQELRWLVPFLIKERKTIMKPMQGTMESYFPHFWFYFALAVVQYYKLYCYHYDDIWQRHLRLQRLFAQADVAVS